MGTMVGFRRWLNSGVDVSVQVSAHSRLPQPIASTRKTAAHPTQPPCERFCCECHAVGGGGEVCELEVGM